MAARLVFIHSRAQENKQSQALKDSWIESLRRGLAKSNLKLPIPDTDIKFPYYGQALFDRVSGRPEDQIAQVIIRGPQASSTERDFMLDVLKEVARSQNVTDDEIQAVSDDAVIERGILNWEAVQRILRALDRHIPASSTASIALATNDVYQYLFNPGVTDPVDEGVGEAIAKDTPTVVVSHSLGTVIAFKALKEQGDRSGWNIPLLVTLGSPLAVTAIRKRLSPLKHPACVGKWFNARDSRDVVALYPLNRANFAIYPEIEDKSDVDNFTDNRHGIEGYLEDPVVAKRIYDALVV